MHPLTQLVAAASECCTVTDADNAKHCLAVSARRGWGRALARSQREGAGSKAAAAARVADTYIYIYIFWLPSAPFQSHSGQEEGA